MDPLAPTEPNVLLSSTPKPPWSAWPDFERPSAWAWAWAALLRTILDVKIFDDSSNVTTE